MYDFNKKQAIPFYMYNVFYFVGSQNMFDAIAKPDSFKVDQIKSLYY